MKAFSRMVTVLALCACRPIAVVHAAGDGEGERPPPVTRWMDPRGAPKPTHEPVRIGEPLSLKLIGRSAATRALMEADYTAPSLMTTGRICIVVHTGIYDSITAPLAQYQADLATQGFSSLLYTYESGSPEALRSYFSNLYSEAESLNGAVLIGDLPHAVFELHQQFEGESTSWYEDFPCDIFYMDVDGVWESLTNTPPFSSDKYDTRSGDIGLEIWVSRLMAGNLTNLGTEADILTHYFDRAHRYRAGELGPAKTVLVYDDDDWVDLGLTQDVRDDSNHVAWAYGTPFVTCISNAEETTAGDYVTNRLTNAYEFIFIRSHGSATAHSFMEQTGTVTHWVYNSDYVERDPATLFYSLYVCGAGDYTVSNNLAGITALNTNDSGLVTWSSTKMGGMWWDSVFLTELSGGETFGEAFREWFNDAQADRPWDTPKFWYGMMLAGDGALWMRRPVVRYVLTNGPCVFPHTNWATAANTLSGAVWAALNRDLVMVSNGTYMLEKELILSNTNRNNIILRSVNGPAVTTIHGGAPLLTNRCIYIHYANPVIDGFTITGGQAPAYPVNKGAGVYCNYGGIITNCVITGNTGIYGAGVYIYNGGIWNSVISGNVAKTYDALGAGIMVMDNGIVENCEIRNNFSDDWAGGIRANDDALIRYCLVENNFASNQGGGVDLSSGGSWVENCVIRGNVSEGKGGGVYLFYTNLLQSCLIASNSAAQGGGVYADRGGLISNCTIAGNTAGGGLVVCATNGPTSTVAICNTIMYGNAVTNWLHDGLGTYRFCCTFPTNDLPGGEGCIEADPLFVDAAAGDFRLATNSPCVDTGTNSAWMIGETDLDGNPRIVNDIVDMGAHELQLTAWDTDGDGLPDYWELDYCGNITNMAAHDDGDVDRCDNLHEYYTGTVPTNGGSFLGLMEAMPEPLGTGFVVRWQSVLDKTYTVYGSTNLPDQPTVLTSSVAATPPTNTYVDPEGRAFRSYWVGAEY